MTFKYESHVTSSRVHDPQLINKLLFNSIFAQDNRNNKCLPPISLNQLPVEPFSATLERIFSNEFPSQTKTAKMKIDLTQNGPLRG